MRQRFDRYERDNETGLDFAQARYYGNIHGRFTSPDAPFADQNEGDPQSWNLYAFVRNNPCTNTDPTGRNTCYFSSNGGKIGCLGDTRIKVVTQGGEGQLIYTPKKGDRQVYDLNNVTAVTYASTAVDPIAALAFEMNRRRPALQQMIGVAALPYVAGAGIATGGAAFGVGGIGFSTTVTTLGIGSGVVPATGVPGFATVTFTSHGAAHALREGFSRVAVESAIRAQVQEIATSATSGVGQFWGRVVVQGTTIVYRADRLADGTINIGTYYAPSKK